MRYILSTLITSHHLNAGLPASIMCCSCNCHRCSYASSKCRSACGRHLLFFSNVISAVLRFEEKAMSTLLEMEFQQFCCLSSYTGSKPGPVATQKPSCMQDSGPSKLWSVLSSLGYRIRHCNHVVAIVSWVAGHPGAGSSLLFIASQVTCDLVLHQDIVGQYSWPCAIGREGRGEERQIQRK